MLGSEVDEVTEAGIVAFRMNINSANRIITYLVMKCKWAHEPEAAVSSSENELTVCRSQPPPASVGSFRYTRRVEISDWAEPRRL